MSKKIVICRGLPWCGKSYRAKEIAGEEGVIFSTDEYFYKEVNSSEPDVYNFKPNHLSYAHKWNFHRATLQINLGHPLVIIDNTNTEPWEFANYVNYAKNQDYHAEIAEPTSERWLEIRELLNRKKEFKSELRDWARQLAEGSKETHCVPQFIIEKMMWRWVPTEQIDLDNLEERKKDA